MIYDYAIIGGGPTGLTMALYLSKINKKCVLIEREKSLGGCHRVLRLDGLFYEHSPRVYSSGYLNFKKVLKEINLNFNDIFDKYAFNSFDISKYFFKILTKKELLALFKAYFNLILNKNYGSNVQMYNFLIDNNFTPNSIEFIDRICLMLDGGDSKKYSLNSFLQILDQSSIYDLYLPKKPNDKVLFKIWEETLIQNKVDILLNSEISKLQFDDTGNLNKFKLILKNNQEIRANKYLFCIPPKSFLDIVKSSPTNVLDSYNKITNKLLDGLSFENYTNEVSYIPTYSVIFHYDKKLFLPNIWGYPQGEWGIIFIESSKYTDFEDPRSQTVLSCYVSKLNSKSSFINKTPIECNKDEFSLEVLRQLQHIIPNLSIPTYYIYNKSKDSSVIETYENLFMPINNSYFNSLYFIGTQNGNSFYRRTTIESAVNNAFYALNTLEGPKTLEKLNIKLEKIILLSTIIKIVFLVSIILIIYKNKK